MNQLLAVIISVATASLLVMIVGGAWVAIRSDDSDDESAPQRRSSTATTGRTVTREVTGASRERRRRTTSGRAGPVASGKQQGLAGEQKVPAEQPAPQQPDVLSPSTIFISYSRKDWDEFVEPLVIDLRQRGFKVWIDQAFILGGDNWYREIQQALETCERMVLCISPNSLGSPYAQREYRYFTAKGKWLLPLICREAPLPWDLEGTQHLPYRERDKLVEILRRRS